VTKYSCSVRYVAVNRSWLRVRFFHLVDGNDRLDSSFTGERGATWNEVWSLASGKEYYSENTRILCWQKEDWWNLHLYFFLEFPVD